MYSTHNYISVVSPFKIDYKDVSKELTFDLSKLFISLVPPMKLFITLSKSLVTTLSFGLSLNIIDTLNLDYTEEKYFLPSYDHGYH